jgi:hypothetical protein
MTPSGARVTVARTLPSDIGQRQVYASLDGQPIATLLYGESVTRDVDPGEHRLRLNNTLVWKTLPFSLDPGDHLEFRFANRPGRWTLGFLSLIGVAPLFLSVEEHHR